MQHSIDKLSQKLTDRSNRWLESRARLESEIKLLKKRAERRIAALAAKHTEELSNVESKANSIIQSIAKQHSQMLAKEKSQRYKLERHATKSAVAYEDKLKELVRTKE